MIIEYKDRGGYWLASGRCGDRVILAEGKTRWAAWTALMGMLGEKM